MKRFLRRCQVVLTIVVVGYLVLLAGRAWASLHDLARLDRAALYARAIDQASASVASPATAAAFRLILPYDTPVEERPANAPAEAFIGTGNAVLPCPMTASDLRREGPGRCAAAHVGFLRPPVCRFLPCTIVEVPLAFEEDPATRSTLRGGAIRKRVCALREPPDAMGWRRDATGTLDCGPFGFTQGVVLLATREGDRDFRYRLLL